MRIAFLSFFLGSAAVLLPAVVQAQSVFTGSGAGPIPDGSGTFPGPAIYGSALNVTFDVNGLPNNIQTILLSITFSPGHTWVGDLDTVLSPPVASGLSSFTIFSRVGKGVSVIPDAGYGSDLNGTYTFSDSGGNLWTAANIPIDNTIPPGNYRTSKDDGTQTSFASDSSFIGMTPAQANGTWTLTLRDGGEGDVGSVSAASLSITVIPEPQAYALMAGLCLLVFAIYRRPLQFG